MYYSYVEIENVAMSFSPARTDLALKLLRSIFHAYALFCCCRANIIGSCITQPKIDRIISIVSGVL
jgi:hypothetical protein